MVLTNHVDLDARLGGPREVGVDGLARVLGAVVGALEVGQAERVADAVLLGVDLLDDVVDDGLAAPPAEAGERVAADGLADEDGGRLRADVVRDVEQELAGVAQDDGRTGRNYVKRKKMESLSTFLLLFILSRVSNRESATVSGFRIWDEHGERICMGSLDPGINQENAFDLNRKVSERV